MLKIHEGTEYKEFLASLCQKREIKLYLEVGVQNGFNLSNISVETAIGVDPAFDIKIDVTRGKKNLHLFKMTSDTFFRDKGSFVSDLGGADISFLDGMHYFEYLLRDFYNAEARAARNGIIAMHDCMPFDGDMIERFYQPHLRPEGPYRTFWTGDVWKVIPILKKFRPDLRVQLIDCNPTGLVCVSNLDPSSKILEENYYDIVQEFSALPNNAEEIEKLYGENQITKAINIISGDEHTLFFRV